MTGMDHARYWVGLASVELLAYGFTDDATAGMFAGISWVVAYFVGQDQKRRQTVALIRQLRLR